MDAFLEIKKDLEKIRNTVSDLDTPQAIRPHKTSKARTMEVLKMRVNELITKVDAFMHQGEE